MKAIRDLRWADLAVWPAVFVTAVLLGGCGKPRGYSSVPRTAPATPAAAPTPSAPVTSPKAPGEAPVPAAAAPFAAPPRGGKSDALQIEIEALARLTPADIAKADADAARAATQAKQHYETKMEALLDQLRLASLKDDGLPDSIIETLQFIIFRSGGGITQQLENWKGTANLPSTQRIFDQMIALAREHAAGRLVAVELPRDRARRIWNDLADRINAHLGAAPDATEPDASPATAPRTRGEVVAAIDALATGERERRAGRAAALVGLQRCRDYADAFVRASTPFHDVRRDATKGLAALDTHVARLTAEQADDPTPTIAFHRAFASGLPEYLNSIQAVGDLGVTVLEAKRREPARWKIPALTALYAVWQGDALVAALPTGVPAVLRALSEADPSEFVRAPNALAQANLLDPALVSSLHALLTERAIDPEILRARGVPSVEALSRFPAILKAIALRPASLAAYERARAVVERPFALMDATVVPVPDLRNRSDVLAALDAVANADAERPGAVASALTTLDEAGAKVAAYLDATRGVLRAASELAGSAHQEIQQWADRLRPSKDEDRAKTFAFHVEFLKRLPERIASVGAVNTLGAAVLRAREKDAGPWALPGIVALYARWQATSLASSLPPDMVATLHDLAPMSVEDAQGSATARQKGERLDRAVATELGTFVAGRTIDLKAVEHLGLPTAEAIATAAEVARRVQASAYHERLTAEFQRATTATEIAGILARLTAGRKQHPDFFTSGETLAHYGGILFERLKVWAYARQDALASLAMYTQEARQGRPSRWSEGAWAKWVAPSLTLNDATIMREFMASDWVASGWISKAERERLNGNIHFCGCFCEMEFWDDVKALFANPPR